MGRLFCFLSLAIRVEDGFGAIVLPTDMFITCNVLLAVTDAVALFGEVDGKFFDFKTK